MMTAIVHCQATYKISDNDAMGILCDFANMVFGQCWEKCPDFTTEDHDSMDDSDEESKKEDSMEAQRKKRRRVQKDLTYCFPSRDTR